MARPASYSISDADSNPSSNSISSPLPPSPGHPRSRLREARGPWSPAPFVVGEAISALTFHPVDPALRGQPNGAHLCGRGIAVAGLPGHPSVAPTHVRVGGVVIDRRSINRSPPRYRSRSRRLGWSFLTTLARCRTRDRRSFGAILNRSPPLFLPPSWGSCSTGRSHGAAGTSSYMACLTVCPVQTAS